MTKTTIDAVDFFYLSMPEVLDIGDGSQDALLVRVRCGEWEGWGECEASPLTSIAAWCCPRSHSACKPVRDSVLGQPLRDASDIANIRRLVRENSFDLLQADHTFSGIDIALWDLLGRKSETPVWRLLGYERSYPKTPYASQLFGDTPQETHNKARHARALGHRAAKFGWGTFGHGSVEDDREQLRAARRGLGEDGVLLVDAGTVWRHDVEAAAARLPALHENGVVWLEEPFHTGALSAYNQLAALSGDVKLAGGEGSHNVEGARQLMEYGGVGFIQIDTGRIGGITSAKQVADEALARGVTFVNHTFTSHLALSASLQPFAGHQGGLCEFPVEAKPLALDMTLSHLQRDANGDISAPDAPGLGITPDVAALRKYLVPVEMRVRDEIIYSTPDL
ncbi:MAG TPA: mandelate racemase/muconate lactonizing enzyme family protein [Abditibacteriaceae bacterium]